MPTRTVHCKVCGKGIRGFDFAERMEKLRRHYKKYHPRIWRESIRRGVEARKKGRR